MDRKNTWHRRRCSLARSLENADGLAVRHIHSLLVPHDRHSISRRMTAVEPSSRSLQSHLTMVRAARPRPSTSFRCEACGYPRADAANRDARRLASPPNSLSLHRFRFVSSSECRGYVWDAAANDRVSAAAAHDALNAVGCKRLLGRLSEVRSHTTVNRLVWRGTANDLRHKLRQASWREVFSRNLKF